MNLHRRHLTAEQKRAVIAAVLKEKPAQTDRQAAARTGSDHKTVGKVRKELEGRGEIPHVETRTDTKGRKQKAEKPDTPRRRAAREARVAPEAQERRRANDTVNDGEIKSRGVGVALANEAINCLIRIPKNDALRERGFEIVADWVESNRHGDAGKHYADDEEIEAIARDGQALLDRINAMTGFKARVGRWKDEKRWAFCDKLEAVSKPLRKLAHELRHYTCD
jgi:hypothetical protein